MSAKVISVLKSTSSAFVDNPASTNLINAVVPVRVAGYSLRTSIAIAIFSGSILLIDSGTTSEDLSNSSMNIISSSLIVSILLFCEIGFISLCPFSVRNYLIFRPQYTN